MTILVFTIVIVPEYDEVRLTIVYLYRENVEMITAFVHTHIYIYIYI